MVRNYIFGAVVTIATAITGKGQPIPLDPSVRTGKLANGFTYYIRHNGQPQKRVELYLVNKVGSILEDDDQQGLAHFMEHMNFNGTRHFPKNELVDYLQKAGVRFGADLNAYTSFDETVYQLPLPTDQPGMLLHGLQIMRDWAQEATLDAAEIEKERGVVLEEERLGKGASDRMQRQYFPMLMNHARYAERLPIGKDAVLTTFKPGVIRRFHHDWYRPDLQALIVVGDIDVAATEKLIRQQFSDLKNPVNERERPRYTMPLTGSSQFMRVTDAEAPGNGIEILMKHRASQLQTEQDYLLSIKRNLLNQLLNSRREAEVSAEPNPAYSGVSLGISGVVSNVDMLSLSVSAKAGRQQQSLQQGRRILERIARYGFTAGELERAKQNYLRGLQSNADEQGKIPSVSYVKEYQRLFLQGEASPGIAWEYRFTKEHINGITVDDINRLLNEYLGSKDVDVLVTAPEKDKQYLPDSATVQGWIAGVRQETFTPWKDEPASKPLLSSLPVPGTVIKKEMIASLGITKLTLSNGLQVILKPTDFKNDQVLYGAFGRGGASLYEGSDLDMATAAATCILNMGFGAFNPVELDKAVTGKVVTSHPAIGIRNQTIMASCSPQDLETALQLTYLQFTAPRKDTLLFRKMIDQSLSGLGNRYLNPNQVFQDTVNYVMSNYNGHMAPPSAERINKIKLDRVFDIYQERFSDASGFTFVFTGSFDPESITPLIARYLGALPATHKQEEAKELGIHIPEGIITKKVYKGTENKAVVQMVLSGGYQYSPMANLELKALGEILQIKVLEQLREAEGEVYSPKVEVALNKYPKQRFAVNIAFGCAPANVDHLLGLVSRELSALREQGPQEEDIRKFKAQYAKSLEISLKENVFWLQYLLSQYENNENVLQVQDVSRNLEQMNAQRLKQAAQIFLSGQNIITFELLPGL